MQDVPSVGNIAESPTDEVAATKLAINGKVEQRQISDLLDQLEPNANGPDFMEPEWALLVDYPSRVEQLLFERHIGCRTLLCAYRQGQEALECCKKPHLTYSLLDPIFEADSNSATDNRQGAMPSAFKENT